METAPELRSGRFRPPAALTQPRPNRPLPGAVRAPKQQRTCAQLRHARLHAKVVGPWSVRSETLTPRQGNHKDTTPGVGVSRCRHAPEFASETEGGISDAGIASRPWNETVSSETADTPSSTSAHLARAPQLQFRSVRGRQHPNQQAKTNPLTSITRGFLSATALSRSDGANADWTDPSRRLSSGAGTGFR